MAVYFWGSKGGTLFGNPAPVISESPDYRGCIVTPEVVHIGDKADGWRESLKYCEDQEMKLISFPNADHQKQIYETINKIKDDSLRRVWIGMRRSSLTGEWYWLSKEPVNSTNWAEGEPGTGKEGQCAIMRADSSTDFGWSDEDCCSDARPVCHSPPILFRPE
ncbi:low affinity immunoglobulin epsilon Fc receptor-like [Tautogolabrus adspersus]